ncbi:hypothetical protein D1V28_000509 [Escherichia coli]|nr:hypothetical protein [Escherichia coli]EEX4484346.1 hypothetical protein [Escherichia coli]
MLTVLFFVLLGLGAAHFIYERIILPSIRLHYRNQLFALRDVAREKIIEGGSESAVHAANLVHDALNNAINRLHLLTLPNKFRAQKRVAEDPAIKQRIKREIDVFKRCEDDEIIDVLFKSGLVLENVLIFNNLMLLLYLLPFVLVVFFCVKVIKTASSLVNWVKGKELEEAIMLLPDPQVRQIVYA